MNSKLISVICVSLASSFWLAPTQKAFAHSVEFQANRKQPKELLYEISSSKTDSSALAPNQGVISAAQSTSKSQESPPVAAASQTTESSQSNSPGQTTPASNVFGGLFVTLVFIGYILGGLQYRKYRTHRAAVLLRQIEALERIWNMESYR